MLLFFQDSQELGSASAFDCPDIKAEGKILWLLPRLLDHLIIWLTSAFHSAETEKLTNKDGSWTATVQIALIREKFLTYRWSLHSNYCYQIEKRKQDLGKPSTANEDRTIEQQCGTGKNRAKLKKTPKTSKKGQVERQSQI